MYEIIGDRPCVTQATKKCVRVINNCEYILVMFPYDKELVSKVKGVRTAKYIPKRKCWRVKNTTSAVKALELIGFDMLSLGKSLYPKDRKYLEGLKRA